MQRHKIIPVPDSGISSVSQFSDYNCEQDAKVYEWVNVTAPKCSPRELQKASTGLVAHVEKVIDSEVSYQSNYKL